MSRRSHRRRDSGTIRSPFPVLCDMRNTKLNSFCSALASTNKNNFLNRCNEDLAIAHIAGAAGLADYVNQLVYLIVVNNKVARLVKTIEGRVSRFAVLCNVHALSFVVANQSQGVAKALLNNDTHDQSHDNYEDGGNQNTQNLANQQRGIAGVQQAAKVGPRKLGYAESPNKGFFEVRENFYLASQRSKRMVPFSMI